MTCPIVVIKDDDWYVAREINTNVASQGKTIPEAMLNLKEALELYFEDDPTEYATENVLFTTLEVERNAF